MKLTVLGGFLLFAAWGQSPDSRLSYDAADVHVSIKITAQNQFARNGAVHAGRHEIRNATMVDLIRFAYGFDNDKIVDGPNWLELDRFDVTAKVPADTSADTEKLMLQSLLRDRFELAVRKENRPLPAYALVAGKKPQMKEAAGNEENGCRPATGGGGEGGGQLMMSNSNGNTTTIRLGPGMTVQYACRAVTMEEFAAAVRTMVGASMGNNPIVDETGIKGKWNFDVRYSLNFFGPAMPNAPERISLPDAIEKQIGLKLEERQVSTPVIVVEGVNRKPTENPLGTAEALPPIPMPTEFEVASVKPTDPSARIGRFQMQPGGRFVSEAMPLRFLVDRAFNTNNSEQVTGLPDSVANERYDITAKTPSGAPAISNGDMDAIAPMLLSLLKDRFQLTYHTEDRPVTGYALVGSKPKMKKADPASRIFCHNPQPPPGAPPGTRILKCQNATMELFAERLRNITPDIQWPVADSTGLEGGWDFTLTFTFRPQMMMAGPMAGGGGDRGAGPAMPEASEPAGGLSIFEAIEKELGLKLDKQKRTMPVIVIDHIESKPTEN